MVDDWNRTGSLWAIVERLKLVQIECADAFMVIERFDGPDVLFYLDPPYLHSVRAESKKAYQCEMTDEDHIRLAKVLRDIQGMAIVSGYPSELYDQLYSGWFKEQCVTLTQKSSRAHEVLWISPRALERRGQMALFEMVPVSENGARAKA